MAWLAAPKKGPKKYFSSGADFAQEPGYLLIDTVKLHEDNAPLCPNRNPCYLPRLLPRNLHPAHVPRRRGGPGLPMGDTRPLADGNAWLTSCSYASRRAAREPGVSRCSSMAATVSPAPPLFALLIHRRHRSRSGHRRPFWPRSPIGF
jgi:hypothetical protein